MLTLDPAFCSLMQRIREGSQAAFAELIDRHGENLHRVVRRKLNRAIRSKFDSGDFVQAVWASFYKNRECLPELTSAASLGNFLAGIARNKVMYECRRRLASQGKNVNRELPLDQSGIQPALISVAPTGSEIAIANERLENLAGGESSRRRRIVELKAAGATHDEIGAALGIAPKTIQRLLRRLHEAMI
jgi:RNA polymerase sigma factor (sigma-70 family)